MASGKPIDDATKRQIEKLRAANVSVRETAKAAGVSTATVQRVEKR